MIHNAFRPHNNPHLKSRGPIYKQRNKYLTENIMYYSCYIERHCWSIVKLYNKKLWKQKKTTNYKKESFFLFCKSNSVLYDQIVIITECLNQIHREKYWSSNEKYNELNFNLFIEPTVDERTFFPLAFLFYYQ